MAIYAKVKDFLLSEDYNVLNKLLQYKKVFKLLSKDLLPKHSIGNYLINL